MSAALQLRIYDGQGQRQRQDDPPFWTLRQAFESRTLPQLQRMKRSKGTVDKWRKAVWYWEHVRQDDPAICNIRREDLDQFPELLLDEQRKLAITTNTAANQQLMYVQAILRDCEEDLARIPRGTPLPAQAPTRLRRIIPLETIDAMYRACRVARYDLRRCRHAVPAIPAPELWRAIIALFFNIGCRRSEGLLMPREAYIRSPEFPDLPGLEIDATSPHGWLMFHTPKTRTRKGGLPLVIPINAALAGHLDRLDQFAPRRSRLLPLGNHASAWRNQLNRIQRAAKIDSPFTWQDIRKTVNRAYRRQAGRDVAGFILGHQPRGVNATWYDDLTEDAIAAVNALPQPPAMAAGIH